jgi:hypothetical protein
MTEPEQKLTIAEPDDLTNSLSFALRLEGRKSQHDYDRLKMAEVAIPRTLFADILPLIAELRPARYIDWVMRSVLTRSTKNHGRLTS